MFKNFADSYNSLYKTFRGLEAPPVDDPDYMPGTKEELGRAANLIANEVPEDQIEKYESMIDEIPPFMRLNTLYGPAATEAINQNL